MRGNFAGAWLVLAAIGCGDDSGGGGMAGEGGAGAGGAGTGAGGAGSGAIDCIANMCTGGSPLTCATTGPCMSHLAGGFDAMPLQATITGVCASVCVVPSGTDGGTEDAGH